MIDLVARVQANFMSNKGQGVVEYALVLAFVAAVAVYFSASSGGVTNQVSSVMGSISEKL